MLSSVIKVCRNHDRSVMLNLFQHPLKLLFFFLKPLGDPETSSG